MSVTLGERGREYALRGLHLVVLWSFAVAQPLFDLLGRTPEFFVVRGSTTLDIVTFGLALVLVLPALLLGVEILAGLASRRASAWLHLALVALLAGTFALQILKRAESLPAWLLVTLAAVLAAAAALVYAARPGTRLLLTVLSPAPIVFLALFLVNSPLERLSLESEAHAGEGTPVGSETPVVMVVFDELATVSLMDERGRIDAGRYPNFASLAADSTWFRNATTVHEHTTESLPAMLTGLNPRRKRLPLVSDHPDNLFTFLGTSYAMNVFEPVTQLCPADLCPRQRESFADRMTSLGEDLSVVFLHVLLPRELTTDLPSVTETWMDFGKEHVDVSAGARPIAVRNDADIDRTVGRQLWADQRTQFEQYALTIEEPRKPTLFFMHAMLPHSPWRFLPSGRQYAESLGIDGIANDRWGEDEWLVTQGWQRHLLQVGFTDRLLGTFLDRLRRAGIYDRALVVAVADHGISFVPGDRRRGVTPTNLGDIASVPLFVKRPGQTDSEVVDRHVRTTDIVPTIADVLGTPLPYRADGRSLFDPETNRDEVVVAQRSGEAVARDADEVVRARDESVARMVETFGSGGWASLFAVGPNAGLVGKHVSELGRGSAGDVTASVDNGALLADVDRQSMLSPAHVTGRLKGDDAARGVDLAISVNGRIEGVTRSHGSEDDVKLSAFLPERAFRDGANDVQVHVILDSGTLAPVGGTGDGAEYAIGAGGESLETPEGSVPVEAGRVDGEVEDWFVERDSVRFGGWAGDVEARKPATHVLAFADDELVYSGTPSVGRADLGKRYPGLGRSGFVVELRRETIGEGGDVTLRFFALRDGGASQLAYPEGFPWAPSP